MISLRLFRFSIGSFWLWLVCLGWTAAPVFAASPYRVILLESMPVPAVLEHSRWFIEELAALGYRNGDTLDLVRLNAEGDRDRAAALLGEAMAAVRPDLVVTNATLASQAAMPLTERFGIPQIFFTVSDPVGAGLIREIGVPTGTGITGIVHTLPRNVKMNMVLRLVRQAIPDRPVRFGFIHSAYPSSQGDIRELRAEARKTGNAVFLDREIPYRKVPEGLPDMLSDVIDAVHGLESRVDFWFEPSGPLGESAEYTQTLIENSEKPVAFGTRLGSVRLGALLHLTPDLELSGRETARLADAVLKGRPPGEIPPTPPSRFKLGVNLGTALKMGIVVPPDILSLAGEDVFR